jgi:murein DD-endopeptidase MepM/ murein hydrolase activator NlpD
MRRRIVVGLAALLCAGVAYGQSLAGDWEGTLGGLGEQLRLTLHVSKTDDGLYLGKLVSLDQGNAQIPLGKATVDGRAVALEFPLVGGTFKGELNAAGSELKGTWSQGAPMPLTWKRTGAAPAAASAEAPKAKKDPAPSPFGPLLDVSVPAAPIPFRGAGGQSHLFYELHITNFSRVEQNLTRIEVLGDNGTMAAFEGSELLDLLMQTGPKTDDARKIGAGLRVVAFLTVPVTDGGAPAKLRHRLTIGGETVGLAPVALRATKAIVIGPPLRGSDWVALNGPNNQTGHRRALIPVGGRALIAQRFAIDWVQMKTENATHTGDPKDNKNYRAYGADVLAVTDATVAATKDGIPQNVPGIDSRAVPITLETVAGNYIILDLGGGNFCMYAHLQPGSLKVKVGDKVKRGQTMALLGNSGNSTEPHLHFQVMDAPSPLGAEGLPYLIDSFELLSGQYAGKKENALPMGNMRVRFGD